MDPNSQESEHTSQIEQTEVTTSEAHETSSPDVTDSGASSSDAAAEAQESQSEMTGADAIRDAFLKEYGDPTEQKGDETPEAKADEVPADAPKDDQKAKAEQDQIKEEKDDGDDEEFRLTDDEFKSLSDNARKRIGHLNAKSKKAERQVQEMQSQLEQTSQAAERLSQLETFVKENRIEPTDMAQAFAMTAKLAQGDHKGFLEAVTPYVEAARQALGQSFPNDIQAQVDDGYLSEEAARELTQARFKAQRAEAESARLQQQSQRQQQEQQQSQQSQALVNAVARREAELKSSDPDYARIADAVQANLQFVLGNGGIPRSPEQAVSMVNQAYELAKKSLPQSVPQATPKRPTANTVARGTQAPASTKDAIIGAMESYVPSR